VAATPETYVAGQLAATVLVLLAMYKLLPALPPDTQLDTGEAAENLLPRVMQYGLPFAALLALSWINSVGDRYLLKWLMDDAAVGLYAAAYSLGSRPTLMVHGVLGGFLRPLLFQAASAGDQRKVRLIFRIWLLGVISSGIAVALAMMLFGEWVAQWLLAREYRATAPLIFLWVAAAYAVFGVVQVVENGILVRGGSRALVLPSLVSALAMVLFNFVLIPKHGAVGAAQATLLAFAMSLAVLSFSMWRAPAVVAAQAPPD
jgi:O-antigen/teichoic acid export membrane protein